MVQKGRARRNSYPGSSTDTTSSRRSRRSRITSTVKWAIQHTSHGSDYSRGSLIDIHSQSREVDIDRTARSLHADNAPDKRNEAMQFMEPLALKIVDLMESLQPAKQENLTRHKIAELEQQLERYKNKGITLTPDKKLPSSSPSPCKTAKFSIQLNVFPMSPVFVTAPFLVQKALKTANSEKRVFSCQTSKVAPEPPSSLVFRRKPAPDVRRAPNSVFCPEKPANSSPLSSLSLVTALSPLAFWAQKCAKAAPVPELLLRRVFRGPTARRGPGSESDSPPRWSVSPPSLSPVMSPLHPAPFLKSPFFRVGRRVGWLSLKFRWFSVESGLQTTTLLRFPLSARKSGELQPAEHVTAWHRVNNGTG